MVLDNRPTTLAIKNLPEGLKSEEAIRNHFKPFAEISSLSVGNTAAVVTFTNRRFAENVTLKKKKNYFLSFTETKFFCLFIFKALKHGKIFNGVPLDLTWQSLSNNSSSTEEKSDKNTNEEEVVEEIYQASEELYPYEEEEEEERSWKR